MSTQEQAPERRVRLFRQIMLWPLQLMPIHEDQQIQNHWELIQRDPAWQEVADEFDDDLGEFHERHYSEFVTFLPVVQRMLYGEGKGCGNLPGESPLRVFRRGDIKKLRVTYPGDPANPVELQVAHVDLYFFYDLDVVILAVELFTNDITLDRAQETLFRLGRSYPTFWHEDGRGGHCLSRVEWLSASGEVLATSDYEKRKKYLSYAARFRAPCIASHWEYLLSPMAMHHSDCEGAIRYRLVEYHRMPVCGYLTFDDPRSLSRGDFMRLALVTAPGRKETLPMSEHEAEKFEEKYCYDRYWNTGDGPAGTRLMCNGEAFIMVGAQAEHADFSNNGVGLLEHFRHQYFLVFLIAHLHKAALFMLSDRLLHALNRLVVGNPNSVRVFKREIRAHKEVFLRFTHRYWFHEVSDQLMAKALYRICSKYLGTDRLYRDVYDEIEDMNEYLDSDSIRRQANMVIRLTVVTIFGLIGTVATGFLGMNLIASAEEPLAMRVLYFLAAFVPTVALTAYTIMKSKKLSDFLDTLSDERLTLKQKIGAFLAVWKPDKHERPKLGPPSPLP
jgi:hypothetical protein